MKKVMTLVLVGILNSNLTIAACKDLPLEEQAHCRTNKRLIVEGSIAVSSMLAGILSSQWADKNIKKSRSRNTITLVKALPQSREAHLLSRIPEIPYKIVKPDPSKEVVYLKGEIHTIQGLPKVGEIKQTQMESDIIAKNQKAYFVKSKVSPALFALTISSFLWGVADAAGVSLPHKLTHVFHGDHKDVFRETASDSTISKPVAEDTSKTGK